MKFKPVIGIVLLAAGAALAVFVATRVLRLTGPVAVCPASTAGTQTIDGEWVSGTTLRAGRSEVKATVADGKIYVVGGLIAGNQPSASVEVFDPESNMWSDAAPLPTPLHHMGVAAYDGRVYVTGGYDDATWVSDVSDSWVYDPAGDSWEPIAPMPGPRVAHEMVTIGDRLYVVGGDAPDDPNAVWAYDPASDTWDSEIAPIPSAREHLAAVVLDNKLVVLGGRWPVFGQNLAAVEVYDPETDTWDSWPDMPTARSGFAAGVVGGRIHLAGGEDLGALCTFQQHEVYDPENEMWYRSIEVPTSRHGIASVVMGSEWYTIAGATGTGNQTQSSFTAVVEIFEPAG
jgi:N-acetylneuraminic acid mutarotase